MKKMQKMIKSKITISLLGIIFVSLSAFMLPGKEAANPLFNEFNKPMDFGKLTAKHITEAANKAVSDAKKDLEKIYAVKKADRTFKNTMLALDDIFNNLNTIAYTNNLMSNVHPDSLVRNEALTQDAVLSKFYNELALDEKLYNAVKEFSETAEAKALTGDKKKFTTETLRDFERSGFALSKEKRAELKTIQDKISETGIEFDKNIGEYADFIYASDDQLIGMPEDFKAARKVAEGKYKIDLSYPSYYPFMEYCESGDARKELFLKFNNRSADKNLEVLQQLLIYRKQMADILGYPSYAAYRVENRMVKTTETVWSFERNLTQQVREKAKKDYDELLEVKRAHTKNPTASVIEPWESAFYNNMLLETKYKLDNEELKEYFEMNHVLDGLFKITQHLFNIQFTEVKNPSVWHSDVRMFEVRKDNKLISRFYLDLYPRANKYGHAACFGMIPGKMTEKGYQMPTATLVCNFPKPSEKFPSLMPHGDVETFFHEFGHVLHQMLTTSELCSFSGTSVSQDFVEAPSQIFENWAWEYEALSMFAKHYKTGKVLPKELHDKMLAARNVGSGTMASTQIFYGSYDMTLHDTYDPNGSETTTDVLRKLKNEITLFPYYENTHFQAAFGHLNGYGASYYGYLWSKVYAEDMFSVFKTNGIMNQQIGIRYRDIILAKGGTEDALELVKQFLDREPNQKAFLISLGL